MPQINLSTLSGPELRQMLDSSRRQGDAALSYKVLQEMAARREAPPDRRSRGKNRPAEPRGFVVDLDEATDADADDVPPMPYWVAPSHEAHPAESGLSEPEVSETADETAPMPTRRRSRRKAGPAMPVAANSDTPPVEASADPPLSLTPEPDVTTEIAAMSDHEDLRLGSREPEPSRAPRPARPVRTSRGGGRMALGFIVGGALGIGVGWWGGGVFRDVASPTAAPMRTAALNVDSSPAPLAAANVPTSAAAAAPTAPVDGAVSPAAEAAPSPAPPQPAADPPAAAEAPTPPPPASAAAPVRTAEAAPKDEINRLPDKTIQLANGAAAAAAANTAGGCASEPTPADRTICGDPDLRKLQRELQKAYAQALAAHEDRTLLRERQLAWRDARSTVTDPDRLSQLYQERIRKLNAAAAEARQLKTGG